MPYLWPNPAETDPIYTEEGAPFPAEGATVPTITDYYQNLIDGGILLTYLEGGGSSGPVIPIPTGQVTSVFGREGDILPVAGDYSADEITYGSGTVEEALDALQGVQVPATRQVIAGAGLTGGGALSGDVTVNVGASNASIVVSADGIAVGYSLATPADIGTATAGTDDRPARANHAHAHGNQLGGSLHALATTSTHGFMSATDKADLAAKVTGPASSVDNTLPRFDSTTGKLVQGSGVVVDDSNNVSGVGTLATGSQTITGSITVSGTVDGRDVSADGAVLDLLSGTTVPAKVTGPASAVDERLVRFDGTTGKLVQSSTAALTDAGALSGITDLTLTGNITLSTAGATVDGVDLTAQATTIAGKVTGPASSVDNTVPRFDLTTGKLIQTSSVVIDDSNNVSGVVGLTMTGNITLSTAGATVDGVDLTALATTVGTHVAGPASSVDNTLPRFDLTTGKIIQTSGVVVDDSNNVSGVAGLTLTGNVSMAALATVDGRDVSADGATLDTLNGTTVPAKVTGPASSTDNAVARFDLATGKLIQNSGVIIDDSNNITGVVGLTCTGNITLSTAGATVDGVDLTALAASVSSGVTGPASSVDNTVPRFDLTTGKIIQTSGVVIDDSNNVTGVASITSTSATVNGNITVTGTVDGIDVSNLGAVAFVTIGTSTAVANERALAVSNGITMTDGGAGGNVTLAPGPLATRTASGTTDTFVLADAQQVIDYTNATSCAVTVPNTSTVNFPVGTVILCTQMSTGVATFTGAASVNLRVPPGYSAKTGGQYTTVALRHRAANEWVLSGGLGV